MTVPMPSTRIAPDGPGDYRVRYAVLGTSTACVVERCENGRWVLESDGVFVERFDRKRDALVYCQEHPEL